MVSPIQPQQLKPAPPLIQTSLKDIMVKCVRCKRDVRAGDYDTHECSTLPTKVEVKMASRVLKRLASTSPEQTLNVLEESGTQNGFNIHDGPFVKEVCAKFTKTLSLLSQCHCVYDQNFITEAQCKELDKVQQLLSIMKEQLLFIAPRNVVGSRLNTAGPPVLKSVGTVTGLNNRSVTFQIGDTSSPPPYPLNTISFTVVGNGSLTTAQMQYSHPNMTLTGLTENNIGSYVLTASNKRLSDDTIIGSSTGSVNLNVQFSPVITTGPSLVAAVLGQPATLVCGTNLRSNPPSSILWKNSNGVTVTTGGRYAYGNGSDNVYIIVSNTTTSDNGTWSCVLNNGVFGPLTMNIVLFIVVPSSQPNNVTANDVSDNTTQLYISWQPPYSLGVPPVSVYMATATSSLDPYPRNRTVNTTAALFTQLRPGLSYDITVAGVSVFQGISAVGPVSDKVVLRTEPTVPSLMCGGLIAASGIVSVSWSVDSGGKDITAVQIAYTLAGTDQQYQPIQASVTPSVTYVIVREQFVASRSYSFQISANNSVGISNIATCGPVFIKEGIPIRPDEPQIISTKPGTITLTLSTAASGSGATGSFKFIISSVPSIDMMSSTYSFPAYIDGQKVSIIISNIKEGVPYYFSIYASNLYGTSPAQFAIRFPNSTVAPATTPATIAPATEKQASSVAGPVAGGVIGGIVFVMVILIIVVFTTYLVLRQKVHKMKQKAVQMEQNSAYGMDTMQPLVDMVVMWLHGTTAYILVQGWDRGKPAAFDVTVTSPLTPVSLNNASASVGAAAYAAECRKHVANDTRCQKLGWLCIPLAVETQAIPKPKMLSEIYSRLNMSLVRSVARAIMGREAVQGVVSFIDADDDCLSLLYKAWYLDDGVLAGSTSSLLRALTIIENMGPSLGIFINLSKCEVFCGSDTTMFLDSMKAFHTPNLDILGAPIGDYIHCTEFIASKRVEALKLLSRLHDVAIIDSQFALTLLLCVVVFIFDMAVKECFATHSALNLTEHAWQQHSWV
eukprot:Em0006g541a